MLRRLQHRGVSCTLLSTFGARSTATEPLAAFLPSKVESTTTTAAQHVQRTLELVGVHRRAPPTLCAGAVPVGAEGISGSSPLILFKRDDDTKGKKKQPGGGSGGNDGAENEGDEVEGEDETTPKIARLVGVVIVTSAVLYYLSLPRGEHVSWRTIEAMGAKVHAIGIYHNFAQVYTDDGALHAGVINDQHTMAAVRRIKQFHENPESNPAVDYLGTSWSETLLTLLGSLAWVAPFIFFPGFVLALTHSIGQASQNANTASRLTKGKMFSVQKGSTTRFTDIAGMKEAKHEITEIVDFLKQPQRYTRLGAKIPTGAMLLGPPGTGKTLLAKAVAGEAGVAFIPCCGSDFVELYVGMGALRVRQLFEVAKQQRCIVYIDEIDAIGMKRGGKGTGGEHSEMEQTLNELLTQLDGFATERGEVIILASSNVAQEQLDKALIRPGRFDRIIHIDAPVLSERREIFKVHLRKLHVLEGQEDLVKQLSGSDDSKGEDSATSAPSESRTVNGDKVEGEGKDNNSRLKTSGPSLSSSSSIPEGEQPWSEERPAAAPRVSSEPGATDLPIPLKSSTDAATAMPASTSPKVPESSATPAPSGASQRNSSGTELMLVNNNVPGNSQGHSASERNQYTHDDGLGSGNGSNTEEEATADQLKRLPAHLQEMYKKREEIVGHFAARMSDLCPGFVGADIANVCNEAAILAARENSAIVDISHLERSIDRVLAGIEHRSRVLSDFEKKVVAHHEAGHAVAGWFLNRADPLMKVSIVPRGGSALGYAQYLPNENHLRTSQELLDSICVTLGGRVAEDIFFGHLSTGASDDLQKVCRMAYMHVANFNTKTAHPAPGTEHTKYVKPFGSRVSDKMDIAAKELVDAMYTRTKELLVKHKKDMEVLAAHLMEHEMLTHADVVKYLGEREKRISDRKIGA